VKPESKIPLENSQLITWLYSSVLLTCGKDSLSIDSIISDPVWFPFEIPYGYFDESRNPVFEVIYQGVGETLIGLSSGTE